MITPSQIHAALDHIAEREMASSPDLLPAVQAQLGTLSRNRSSSRSRVIRVMVLVTLLLLALTAIAYGYSQGWLDRGLQHILDRGLHTDLNIEQHQPISTPAATENPGIEHRNRSATPEAPGFTAVTPTPRVVAAQTIKDVTVTLNWAYADANRLAVRFTITGVTLPEGIRGSYQTGLREVTVTDHHGARLLGSEATQFQPGREPGSWVVTKSFGQSSRPFQEKALDLAMTIGLGGFTTPAIPKGHVLTPGPIPGSLMAQIAPIGDFTFRFTIPVYPAVRLEPNQPVRTGPITMTLHSLSVAPSLTAAVLCYNLPDNGDWTPEAVLAGGSNEPVPDSGSGLYGASKQEMASQTSRCWSLDFLIPYPASDDPDVLRQFFHNPSHLTLRVDSLHTSLRYDLAAMKKGQAELKRQGIAIEWSCPGRCGTEGGYNIQVSKMPAGITVQEAQDRFTKFLQRRVEGPWTFEVDLP
jgi:hypothetical protein